MSAQPCSGAEAAQLVQDTLGDGFSLAGRRGFYFLYELLTGQATLTLTLTLSLTLNQPYPPTGAPFRQVPQVDHLHDGQRRGGQRVPPPPRHEGVVYLLEYGVL